MSYKKDDKLFKLKSPNDTGIDFNNEIIKPDSFNILTDEYIINGGGLTLVDFDQNDLPDLFFSGNQVANKFYLNHWKFKFEDVSFRRNRNSLLMV